jgi:hypothetical protein
MIWIVPPENQGQGVEIAYAEGYNGTAYRRVTDLSDRSVSYERAFFADMDEEVADAFDPANGEPAGIDWEPCEPWQVIEYE